MKALLIMLLLQHAVISAKAGLITYVRSMTISVDDHIGEGNQVESRRGSRFEAMLGPDTYIRMRDNAGIRLESEALDRIVVRVVHGAVIIDAHNVDGDIPIRVVTDSMNGLDFSVVKDGLYLFEEDRVAVLDGEMRVDDALGDRFDSTRLRKDWAVGPGVDGNLGESKLDGTGDIDSMALVRWSRQRTEQLTPEPTFMSRPRGRRFRFPF